MSGGGIELLAVRSEAVKPTWRGAAWD